MAQTTSNVGDSKVKRSGMGNSRVDRGISDEIDDIGEIGLGGNSRFIRSFSEWGSRFSNYFRGMSARQWSYVGVIATGLIAGSYYLMSRKNSIFNLSDLVDLGTGEKPSRRRSPSRRAQKSNGRRSHAGGRSMSSRRRVSSKHSDARVH